MQEALKFWPIDKIECILLAGEETEGHTSRGSDYAGGFLDGEFSIGDRAQRQMDKDLKPASAPAFLVNLGLRRFPMSGFFHDLVAQ